MLQRRAYASAVTLNDGSVLVAGGSRNGQPLDTAERYIPDAGTWVAAGRLNLPRTQSELTLLADGRALATGGGIEGGPTWSSTASAEIFDPKTSQWSLVPPMSVARARHTATLLPSGEVLVAGGATTYHLDSGQVTASAELFNPRTNSWRAAAPMSEPRYIDGSVLLHDGRVLVAGGWYAMSNSDPSHETAEIYDPAADRWSATGSMKNARAEYGIAILADGRVLVAGGTDKGYNLLVSTELFDPATGSWTTTGDLHVATMWSAIQTLADGRVLISGGGLDASATTVTAVCEVYTPASG
jgi:N-acetylneuraminic acid mutarotase